MKMFIILAVAIIVILRFPLAVPCPASTVPLPVDIVHSNLMSLNVNSFPKINSIIS